MAGEARWVQRRIDEAMLGSLAAGGWQTASEQDRAGMASWIASQQGSRRRGRLHISRRQLDNACVASGLAPDGRGRHRVERVLRWRGNGQSREALVEWAGFDATSNRPWANSWVPRRNLTADLREEGRIRARRERRAPPAAPAMEGRRVSPRIAGVAPIAGLDTERRKRRRAESRVGQYIIQIQYKI